MTVVSWPSGSGHHEESLNQFGLTLQLHSLESQYAQIMLGMVTPQVLQMPNIRQASVPPTQPVLQDGQQGQQLAVQTLSGLPPLAQSKMQLGLMPKGQEGQVSAMPHNSLVHSQFSALPQQPAQPQIQLPPQGHNQALQQATFAGQSGPGSSTFSSIPETTNNSADRSSQVTNNTYSNMSWVIYEKRPFSTVGLNLSTSSASASGPSQVLGIGSVSANQISKAEEVQHMDKKAPQLQLPPEIESALLQQVLNLTPEQLSSLPPEQQQEVIQLQQMLR
ncbi:hypothetical protein AAG906_014897 [Vitis piasezkii]